MAYDIIGTVACTLIGLLIALLNYAISKKVLETHPEKLAVTTVLRQIIQIGYLITVYCVGSKLDISLTALLVGAVAGMTVPMLFFTKKLVSINQNLVTKKEGEDENG